MKKNLVRRGAILALAAVMTMGLSASVFAADKPMGNADTTNEKSDTTEVEGQVVDTAPGDPSYVITIPEKIDFGTLKQPTTNTDSFKTVEFTVTAEDFNNIASGSAVAVLVKDSADTASTDNAWNGEFAIKQNGNELKYSVLNPAGTDLNDTRKGYEHGLLFSAFAVEGSVQGTAKLNQKQLYGKDLKGADKSWVGIYKGTMDFYAKVVSAADYQ